MSTVEQRIGAGFLLQDMPPEDVLTPEDMEEEHRMMRDAIREFAAQEVIPNTGAINRRDPKVVRELFEKAADLGLYMAEVPEAYGGLELSVLGIAGMMEARSDLGPLASTVFAHQGIGSLPLVNFGTQQQIDRYLEKLMNGKMMAAFALTEPSSGSDAMNIKTTATLNGGKTHYAVNGSKQFITNAGWADLFILFAKVDGTHFTAFLLERDTEGLVVAENEKLLGIHGSSVCGLTLDNAEIPVENVLGEVGQGHRVAMCTLNLGRLKMSTNCVGGGKKALACAAQYAAERTQFGHALADFGLIQQKLANMAARVFASQSIAYRTAGLVYQAIEDLDEAERHSIEARLNVLAEFAIECALSKVHGSEMVNWVTDETLQIHGGYGYSEEYAPAKMYRDWRITRIYEGTSEICRLSAMKALLRKAARGQLDLGGAFRSVELSRKPDSSVNRDSDLHAMRKEISDLKKIFLYLLGLVHEHIGHEPLLDNRNQQFLSSLADIALEIYASESAVLRVLKLQARFGEDTVKLSGALARLYFEYSAERIRQEVTEILADLFNGDDLRHQLDLVGAWLPLPSPRLPLREFVAQSIVESRGELPEYRN